MSYINNHPTIKQAQEQSAAYESSDCSHSNLQQAIS